MMIMMAEGKAPRKKENKEGKMVAKKNKKCSRCHRRHPPESYRARTRATTKTCQDCRDRDRFLRNQPGRKVSQRVAWFRARKGAFMKGGCVWDPNGGGCIANPAFMQRYGEFDHVGKRTFWLSRWAQRSSRSRAAFDLEAAKCRPLCPNHHQLHSEHQRATRRKTKTYSSKPANVASRRRTRRNKSHNLARKRAAGACASCARPVAPGNEAMFQWDHRNPNVKNRDVANLQNNASLARIDAEIALCRLLCHNCAAQWNVRQRAEQHASGFKLALPAQARRVRLRGFVYA
jgi:hypothetical protein